MMESCVPMPVPENVLNDLVEKAKDYCLMHGICMRRKDSYDRDALHFAPFLLFPSPFPKTEFLRSLALQPLLNELMHNVAHDREFLKETLRNTIKVDEFTAKLFDLYETVQKEGVTQNISLGMIRSDLMLDTHPCSSSPFCCWKQVEINTIASGFGWLGPASGLIHRYVLKEMGRKDLLSRIPENKALEGLAGAMLEAWTIYNEAKSVIMFIVEDLTYNICDQKFHEFEIRRQNPDVYVIRKTLTDVSRQGRLTPDKRLFIDDQEVAVIYFRCGYSPDQYPTKAEWDARLMMERSMAIKSPSIHYHLAGTKKVQQRLSEKEILNKFIKDKEDVDRIRDVFTGLYSLDNSEVGDKALQAALRTPEAFVVKPQREGGGNNVYGDEISTFLQNIKDSEDRDAYILMDRIFPPTTLNYMVRPGCKDAKLVKCVSELGIFGYIIGDDKKIMTNRQVGHMLRTKLSDANEGGVAAGLGALDSVFLLEVDRCCDESCSQKVNRN